MLSAGVLLFGCGQKESEMKEQTDHSSAIRVELAQANERQPDLELNYSGIVEPVTSVPLSFQVPGIVSKVYVDLGDKVYKGQVLAEIDKTSYQSAHNAAVAKLKQAQDAYNRMKKVYDAGSLPEIKWEEVKANLEQATSAEQIAGRNLSDCQIKSSIDGTVGTKSIELGESAAPGLRCFQIFSEDKLYVKISASENEINKIVRGQKALITFPTLNEITYEGEADKIAASADIISKTFEVKFKLHELGTELKPGMMCNVEIPVGSNAEQVLIPIQSVMKDTAGESYIFLVDKQTKTTKKQLVKTSGIIDNMLLITSGLKPGDWYVVEGQQKLNDNALVNFN